MYKAGANSFFQYTNCVFLYDRRVEMPPVSEYKNVKTLFVNSYEGSTVNTLFKYIYAVFGIDYSHTVLSVPTSRGSWMARSVADRLGSLQ